MLESRVEAIALKRSGMELRYAPEERIGIIIVDSFPELGRLAALRFLEWVQNNPGGVICLPTGKTPEYFIKEVGRYLENLCCPGLLPYRLYMKKHGNV